MQIPIEISAAATELGISRQALHRYVQDGRLPVYWIGSMRVIDPAVWADWKARYLISGFDERGGAQR